MDFHTEQFTQKGAKAVVRADRKDDRRSTQQADRQEVVRLEELQPHTKTEMIEVISVPLC